MGKDSASTAENQLARGLSNPLRARLLRQLTATEASPVELAELLGEPLSNVSYHVRVLADLDLIELTRTTPRRGAVEHHYRARTMAQPSGGHWAALPDDVRAGVIGDLFGDITAHVQEAVSEGHFQPEDAHTILESLTVDKQGATELRKAMRGLQQQAKRIARESKSRARQTSQPAGNVRLAMLLFGSGPEPPATKR